jgi:hypothetical protein
VGVHLEFSRARWSVVRFNWRKKLTKKTILINKGAGRQLLDKNEDPKYLERFVHPHQGDMVEHSDVSWL